MQASPYQNKTNIYLTLSQYQKFIVRCIVHMGEKPLNITLIVLKASFDITFDITYEILEYILIFSKDAH